MTPEEVEQMLFDHAMKTKIRAPLPERVSSLGYNRVVTSGIVAGAALVCSLVVSKSVASAANSNLNFGGLSHPSAKNSDASKRPVYHMPQSSETIDSGLAMSPVGS